jgi:hypothetical protein
MSCNPLSVVPSIINDNIYKKKLALTMDDRLCKVRWGWQLVKQQVDDQNFLNNIATWGLCYKTNYHGNLP